MFLLVRAVWNSKTAAGVPLFTNAGARTGEATAKYINPVSRLALRSDSDISWLRSGGWLIHHKLLLHLHENHLPMKNRSVTIFQNPLPLVPWKAESSASATIRATLR